MSIIDQIHEICGLRKADISTLLHTNRARYRTFTVGTKRKRIIKTPIPSLMIAQRAILQLLKTKIQPHDAAHGYITGRSVKSHATTHMGKNEFVKSDIQDCFGNIRESYVRSIFREAGYSTANSFVGARLCCDDGCLPQGAPTSPYLCNIALRRFDTRLHALGDSLGAKYTRYGDDIVISGSGFGPAVLEPVRSIFLECNLPINEAKTYYAKNPRRNVITGISISTGNLKIPKKNKRIYRAAAHNLLANGITSASYSKSGNFDAFFVDRVIGQLCWWSFVEEEAEPPREYLRGIRSLLSEILSS